MLLLTLSRQNKRIHFWNCLDTWKYIMLLDHVYFVLSKRETIIKQRILCCLFSWHRFRRLIIMDNFGLIAISITIDMRIICCLSYTIHDLIPTFLAVIQCHITSSLALRFTFNSITLAIRAVQSLKCQT